MDEDILEKSCVIYAIINTINGKIYVGQTRQKLKFRIWAHKNHNEFCLGRAIKKYGWKNFKIEILEECFNEDELNEREIFWIDKLNCKVPNGYNLTDGGEGVTGLIFSEESRKLRSKNNPRKRSVRCLDTGEIFESAAEAARHFNILASTICSVCRGKFIRSGGMKFEYLDQPLSEENRFREAKEKCKKVICVETGIIYPSIKEASRQTGTAKSLIANVCRGIKHTTGGYHWEFVK